MEKYNAVLLIGPPGSGKGTQGNLLARTGNYYHVSMGDVMRNLQQTDPDLAAIVRSQRFMYDGKVCPATIYQIFEDAIQRAIGSAKFHPGSQILVLDGTPRFKEQIPYFADGLDFLTAFYLDIRDSVALERIAKRAEYNQRTDGKKRKINKKRLRLFKRTIPPILEYFNSMTIRIDAEKSEEDVYAAILKALGGAKPINTNIVPHVHVQ